MALRKALKAVHHALVRAHNHLQPVVLRSRRGLPEWQEISVNQLYITSMPHSTPWSCNPSAPAQGLD